MARAASSGRCTIVRHSDCVGDLRGPTRYVSNVIAHLTRFAVLGYRRQCATLNDPIHDAAFAR